MPKSNAILASLALVLIVGLSSAAVGQQAAPTADEASCPAPNNSLISPPRSAQDDPNHRDWDVSVGDDDVEEDQSWMNRQQVARIVLYDPANFGGRRIGITRDTPDLGERSFADIASSIRVYQGTWQLCDEPNYGGTCRCFSSHANVNRIGFGNPVTDANLETEGFSDTVASVRLVPNRRRR